MSEPLSTDQIVLDSLLITEYSTNHEVEQGTPGRPTRQTAQGRAQTVPGLGSPCGLAPD